jgi:hypothetical protein
VIADSAKRLEAVEDYLPLGSYLRPEIALSSKEMTARTNSTNPTQIRKFRDWTRLPVMARMMAIVTMTIIAIDIWFLPLVLKS